MKILFAWDFHGTLEKDNVYAVKDIIDEVLISFNINKTITLKDTVEHYGLSWVDYFHFVHPGGDLGVWRQMKERAREIQKNHHFVEKYIKQANHAEYVLRIIKKRGHINIVLSNSAPKWIKYFIKLVKLDKYIDRIFGLDLHDIVRKGKDTSDMKFNILKQYIKKNKFDKIVKIGDRDSDIKAGKLIGATTYYIRNEYNKNHKIEIKPDFEITDLKEVLKEL